MKQKIYFRADASADIGYGHFIRTLALADMLKDNFDCTYYTVGPTDYQIKELSEVCRYVSLNKETHFQDFLSYLTGDEIVVLDNYYYSTEYQQAIKDKGCRLVCIDDMHDKHYVSDIVINHGLDDANFFSCESYTKLCLGNQWALLRRPFLQEHPKRDYSKIHNLNVLISFGGVDKYNLSEKTALLISRLTIVSHITIISGIHHNYTTSKSPKITVKHSLTAEQIVNEMEKADLAILSASTVCLESKACGLPMMVGYYVDNQVDVYHKYLENDGIIPLGNLLDSQYENILIHNFNNLKLHSDSLKNRIDNDYVQLFKWLSLKSFDIDSYLFKNYIELTDAESYSIWQLRNSIEIRQYMDNTTKFSYDSHKVFIKSLCQRNDIIYWSIYSENYLLGSINITFITPFEVERGIFLNPNIMGKGIGYKMEYTLYTKLREMGIKTIDARVVKSNMRSLKYHKKLGYTINKETNNHFLLIKIL